MATWPSVLFALLAAASNALATVLQRRAARTVPLSAGLRLGLLVDLLHRAVWLGGMLAVVAAACFQALALSQGALSVVQPLFVLELPLALLIGRVLLGGRIPRSGWAGWCCSSSDSAQPSPPPHPPSAPPTPRSAAGCRPSWSAPQ